jgi:hypothetical protein
MAPTLKRERHLDLWSSIFQAIWPGPPIISVVGRSPAASRVFLPSVYFLNGRNNKRSQPSPRRTGRAFGIFALAEYNAARGLRVRDAAREQPYRSRNPAARNRSVSDESRRWFWLTSRSLRSIRSSSA